MSSATCCNTRAVGVQGQAVARGRGQARLTGRPPAATLAPDARPAAAAALRAPALRFALTYVTPALLQAVVTSTLLALAGATLRARLTVAPA
jgi:hypothetical protein